MNTKRFSNFGATAGFFAALAAVLAVLFLAACEPEKQTAARSSASLEQEPVRWSQATSAAAFSKRSEHASLAFDGKLWVIGGKENRSAVTNNIWSSDDGVTWNQVAQKVIDASRFASRANFPAVVFKNKMWVLGGDTYLRHLVVKQRRGVESRNLRLIFIKSILPLCRRV